MSQLHLHRLSLPQSSTRFKLPPLPSLHRRREASSLKPLTNKNCPLSSTSELNSSKATVFRPLTVAKSRIACRFSQSDITPQFELGKAEDKRKPQKQANGIFWIILINLGIYVADHFFQVRSIKSLYLYHNFPAWYQFVTATFCHANWNHLSSNLFFLYIFGKLVEEEEGNFGLWLSYLFTGVGANLVSWLVLPRNAVSVGASGAVFGLFAISVLVKFELDKTEEKRKPQKRANGIFWIILINLGIYVADHFFQVRSIKSLYLYHNFPVWYQFVTATFCHANWNHLSSNLFFLYIFGKLVEEEEGNFGLWLSYLFTGVGANLVSWLVLPRNAVSVGASGAVFGLFAISVLVKMSWDWRKILEVLILGQFVVERVMEAAQASAGLSGTIYGGYSLQTVNHIAHLSGALVGVVLVWLLSKIPSGPADQEVQKSPKK